MGHPLYTALSGISHFQVRVFFAFSAGTWIRPLSSSLSSFLSHHPSPLSCSLSLLPVLSSLPLPAVLSSFLLSLRPFLSPPSRSEYFQPFLLGPGLDLSPHPSPLSFLTISLLLPSLSRSFLPSLSSPLSFSLFVLFSPPSRLGWFSYFSSLPEFWKFYFNGKMLRIITVTEVRTEVSESQKEVERILLPFTVDWRARVLFGSTYTMSFCCR